MEKYPFKAIVFTDEVATHELPFGEYGDFAIDLDSLVVPKNPCVVDFNHDSWDVIGYANIDVVDHKIVADGNLISAAPNDRAASIAEVGKEVPYGISPTLDLEAANCVEVVDGDVFQANGREYIGPLRVYQNAVLLGISVCTYPTDVNTSFTPLKKGRLIAMSKYSKLSVEDVIEDKIDELADLNDEPQDEEIQDADGVVKNPELQEYIDKFGLSRGVKFYQEDTPIEEAVAQALEEVIEENLELKARLSKFEADADDDPKDDDAVACSDDDTEDKTEDETTKLRRALARVEKRLAKFETRVSKELRSRKRGDKIGLSASRGSKRIVSYQDAFQASVK